MVGGGKIGGRSGRSAAHSGGSDAGLGEGERSHLRPIQDGGHVPIETTEKKPSKTVRVGGCEVPFNQHATRWLGVWIDSKMTPKVHHSARMKKARKAMQCIRRLTGQMGMCSDACRRELGTCVQASALYQAELWWDDRQGAGSKTGVTNFRSWKISWGER